VDSIRPIVVATPYLTPGIKPPAVAGAIVEDGYAGSVGQVAEGPEPAEGLSTGKRVILAGLALLSVGGAIGGAFLAQPPVATVSTSQAAQVKLTPEQQAAEVRVLIDGMIDSGRNGREVPESLRKLVHDRLDAMPLDVVRAVFGNGTKIAIMREGETPVDVGVIRALDVSHAYEKPAELRGIADQAFASADATHGKRIADLERRIEETREAAQQRYKAHPEEAPRPVGLGGMFGMMGAGGDLSALDPEVIKLMGDLNTARTDRQMEAWDQITRGTNGRLEPFGASMGIFNPQIAVAMNMMPTSLEGLAKMHGAETPAEVKAFIDLTVAVNGDRIAKAQDDFKASMAKFQAMNPALAAQQKDLAFEQRPFVGGQSDVVIPSYYLSRTASDAAPQVVSGHDYGSLRDWKADATAGQFWFKDDIETVVLHEKYLERESVGSSTTVHEFGHAYEDALRDQAPQFYRGFGARWRAAYRTNFEKIGENRFPTGYASTNPGEFFAEEFAVHFGDKRDVIEARDRDAAGLMREALDAAPQASGWNVAAR